MLTAYIMLYDQYVWHIIVIIKLLLTIKQNVLLIFLKLF